MIRWITRDQSCHCSQIFSKLRHCSQIFSMSNLLLFSMGGPQHNWGHRHNPELSNNRRRAGSTVGLSEIGAEGQKVQKSKLVTFFLL